MSSKRQPSPEKFDKPAAKVGQPQFVNYDMNADEKAMFKKWAHEHAPEVFDLIDKVLEEGINVSVKWDNFNHCYACYLVPGATAKHNIGFILTGRGASSFGAIAGALYRHLVLFEGEWGSDEYRRYGLDDD